MAQFTGADEEGLLERARVCLAGKSRGYVDDAKVFAQATIDLIEAKRKLATALAETETELHVAQELNFARGD